MTKWVFAWSGEQPILSVYWNIFRHVARNQAIGCAADDVLVWSQGKYLETYFSEDSIKKLNEQGELLLVKSEREKLSSEIRKTVAHYWQAAGEARKRLQQENLSNEELAKLFRKIDQAMVDVFTYFASSRGEVMQVVETKLAELLRNKYGEDFRDIYLKITMPVLEDMRLAEKQAWFEVAKQSSVEKLRQHALKYPFQFFGIYSWEKVIELLESRLKQTNLEELKSEIEKEQNKHQNLKREQEKLFAEINSEEVESLARFIQEQAHLRFELKACWGGNDFYLLDFYKELAKRSMLPLTDLAYYSIPPDFFDFLEKGKQIDIKEVQKRKQHCLLHIHGGKMDVYSGEAALAKRKELLDSSLPSRDTKEIKGLTANTGKVMGVVKLVKVDNAEEVAKIVPEMKLDTILVTGMTNPTMVPLMKNLRGIVTDEGGMACHAAIMSRELNVPCIVGCRIATRVLSDGDYIELDADNGIVRKLKKGD